MREEAISAASIFPMVFHEFLTNGSRAAAIVLGASLLFASGASAQGVAADLTTGSQQERAEAAMERSLVAQQSAVERFREARESDSLKKQNESILRQTNGIGEIGEIGRPSASERPTPAERAPTSAKSFFSSPWPSSAPLSVPNIQMVDDTCQPMQNDEIEKLVQSAAKKQGIEPQLLKSVMRQESAFKPCAVSTAGAMGLMQIMPDTAEMLGLDDPFDPAKNTEAGAQFLKMMLDRYQGDVSMALGAYNAGPGKVDKAGGVPPISETLQYVSNILRSLSLVY